MRFSRSSHLLVHPIFVFALHCAGLTGKTQEPLAGARSQARAIIEREIGSKVPGLAVAVAIDGATVWSEGFGYADLAAKKPVTPLTRFRVGSVSKPLTAAGLALLLEQGQMDLDAPVQRYIPDFPQKKGIITLRLLAGHLSGIRNYHGREALSNLSYPNLRSGLKIFEDDPLEFLPGTKFSYSSYNWNTIGAAMETAARQDFLQYMQARVFGPLGMANTQPDRVGTSDPQRAVFYETGSAGEFIVAPRVDCSFKWPSGGFLSTAEDLVRFGSTQLRPGFLKPESLKLLFTSQRTVEGKLTHYGIGWFVGRTILYHTGDAIGGGAILLLEPASGTVVAIACNRGRIQIGSNTPRKDLNMAATAQKLARIFDGEVKPIGGIKK